MQQDEQFRPVKTAQDMVAWAEQYGVQYSIFAFELFTINSNPVQQDVQVPNIL